MKKLLHIFLLLFLTASSLVAQEEEARTLVIGDLLGRTEPQQATVLTSKGNIGLLDARGQEIFDVVMNSGREVVVKFKAATETGINRIVYRFFDSESALIAALVTGEVDFAVLEDENSAAEVEKSNREMKVRFSLTPSNTVQMVAYNCEHPILRSTRVRVALSYAIDKQGILTQLLRGKAYLARGPFSSNSPAYLPGLEEFGYDPKQALLILEGEGWSDSDGDGILDKGGVPLRFVLLYREGLILEEGIIRWIKINLNEIGVDVVPRPYPMTEIRKRLDAGDFDAYLTPHRFTEDAESLAFFFSASEPTSFLYFRNRTLENYFGLYRRLTDPQRKRPMFQAIQKLINREQPVTFLYFKWLFYYLVNRRKFDNFLDARGNLRPIETWTVRESARK